MIKCRSGKSREFPLSDRKMHRSNYRIERHYYARETVAEFPLIPKKNGPCVVHREFMINFHLRYSVELFHSFRLGSHGTGRIFDGLKNLTAHFVNTEPFNIFALFTQNCRPGWILTFVRGFTICSCAERYLNKFNMASPSWVTTHPCNHAFTIQKFSRWRFKFWTVPVKNLTSILAFKCLNG